jgi:hypothetical protein
MRLPKDPALTLELYEAAERAGTDIEYGEIGPGLITKVAKERGLSERLRPQPEIYPIPPVEALNVLLPSKAEEVRGKIGRAPFLHLWNEMLGRAAVLRWVGPPAGSYIRELFDRHGVPTSDQYCYSAAEMERVNLNHLRAIAAESQFRRARKLEADVEELRRKLAETEAILAALRFGATITGGV